MKRHVTETQRNGMHALFVPKPAAGTRPDCAHCRHSKVEIVNGAFRFACKLAYVVMDAPACSDFRDSRKHLDVNYLRGQVANG